MAETRKRTVILSIDAAGDSRISDAAEELALNPLRVPPSDLIDSTISVHHGRVVKRAGEARLIEFRSVVDAVNYALRVQSVMIKRSAGLAPEHRVAFRIGVHTGDVVEESGGDLKGDGVNIAARLEGICAPNGICLSEDAFRHVKAHLRSAVTDLGNRQLENIAQPVHAYAISLDRLAPAKSPPKPRVLKNKRWVQRTIGLLAAEYLRLVWRTSRFRIEPEDFYERVAPEQPVIIAFWHGQHFMAPFLRRQHRVKVLISRHGDGELNAIAAERLGLGVVRGSGDDARRFNLKGGFAAFRTMLRTLDDGWNMALTADIPKTSRVAGLGIVTLARESGRPIYPASFATSRRIVLNNWDRSEINLPLSRGAIVMGAPIRVPRDADAQTLEVARKALELALNTTTERAHAIVDRRG
jgi:lysophospholipid acyltransferase (LPLAT)-like uncharacterized protein/class 3 adenylate cyclase